MCIVQRDMHISFYDLNRKIGEPQIVHTYVLQDVTVP